MTSSVWHADPKFAMVVLIMDSSHELEEILLRTLVIVEDEEVDDELPGA